MIIEPLAGPCSAISARRTTSTYQAGKSSCCVGSLSVLIGAPNASRCAGSGRARLAARHRSQVAPSPSFRTLALRLPSHRRRQALDARLDLCRAHRLGEEEALAIRAAQRAHPLGLLLRLDAL